MLHQGLMGMRSADMVAIAQRENWTYDNFIENAAQFEV